jgi:feruloyl-CoA synthase
VSLPPPVKAHPFVERSIELTRRDDGTLLLRSKTPFQPVQDTWPTLLARHAARHPQRTWLAQRRGPDGQWMHLRYGEAKAQVDAVTQALLELGQRGRSVVVLSENSLEHAVVQLAAMQAHMPYVPLSPAYSLLTPDVAKLQSMVDLLEPAVVFAQDGQRFGKALRSLRLAPDATLVCVDNLADDLAMHHWDAWVRTPATAAVETAITALAPDTVAKYLFTSGSTGLPKAAVITHGMLSSSIGMHEQVEHGEQLPPMEMLDWLPWSHVASGNVIFGRTLSNGGTVWLDEGKPLPGRFEPTVRNLMEVSPTEYAGVPLGYTMLVTALEENEALAQRFFAKLQKVSYAGAKMPESIIARMQAVAVRTTGQRIPFISAFGSTETAASVTISHWNTAPAGCIGLPHPGVTLKLLPLGEDRYEIRVRSVAMTPGYLKNPEATAAAFDEEGFFLMGDAVQFVDAARPEEGLTFSGRVAEEFKLQSGIFVRVGNLRPEALEAAGGLLTDAVVAGADEAFVALLAWPNLAACRKKAPLPQGTDADILGSGWLRDTLREAFRQHNLRCGGSSRRIARVLLLAQPPDLGAGELTDKGYVNQRLVLQRRNAEVRRLYAQTPDPDVIVID